MLDAATRERVDEALLAFWGVRSAQHAAASQAANAQGGTRSAVVGGQHLDAVRDLIAEEFVLAGHPSSNIHRRGRSKTLPGWFRPTKNWDLVVTSGVDVIAAIELKSQVGSIGNNANNRTEEAIGNAVDVDIAYRKGLLGPTRPWLGYIYITEDTDAFWRPAKRLTNAHYQQRERFSRADAHGVGASYAERFGVLGEELVDEGLYQAAWVVAVKDPFKEAFAWRDVSSAVSYEGFVHRIGDLRT
jgi:hypothetical protein